MLLIFLWLDLSFISVIKHTSKTPKIDFVSRLTSCINLAAYTVLHEAHYTHNYQYSVGIQVTCVNVTHSKLNLHNIIMKYLRRPIISTYIHNSYIHPIIYFPILCPIILSIYPLGLCVKTDKLWNITWYLDSYTPNKSSLYIMLGFSIFLTLVPIYLLHIRKYKYLHRVKSENIYIMWHYIHCGLASHTL